MPAGMPSVTPRGCGTEEGGHVGISVGCAVYFLTVGNLVGGLEHQFYFPIQLGIIIPTDVHIFQRG